MTSTGAFALIVMLSVAPGVLQAQLAPREATALEGPLLTAARVARLPPGAREAWRAYVVRSEGERQKDEAALARELARVGTTPLARAPMGSSASLTPEMTAPWFRGEEGRRLVDAIVSFQAPSGGWSKRLDYARGSRAAGQGYASESDWSYVATFDNDATVSELRVLSRAFDATGHAPYRDAFTRGLDHIARAQFPTGCWPQGYPLRGSYHDAATFNDDVIVNVVTLLREVAAGRHAAADRRRRDEAGTRATRGIACIVATQVQSGHVRTAWGAQHDPLTMAPVGARAYEHPGIDAGASARVVHLLMQIERPDAAVVAAVHGAVAWFRATAVRGLAYEKGELFARDGAGPLWPRFSDVGSNRPIFSNRDGVVHHEWSALLPERRYGYAWYTARPAAVLATYETWKPRHPLVR